LSRELLDICDTSRYGNNTFDLVLAYGGPLSYAFEQTEDALNGMLRITKPGGYVVASVMSSLGSWRHFFEAALEEAKELGEELNDFRFRTGDLRHTQTTHVCQMFRSREIAELVTKCGGELIAMSASNWSSLNAPEVLEELESDSDRWTRFIEHEVIACGEPGAVDGGTHLLFAVRKLVA
jgi:SAM-dependent methyltransferase